MWQQRHKDFQASLGAELSFGPVLSARHEELSEVLKNLKSEVTQEAVGQLSSIVTAASASIGEWRKLLRTGATGEFEKMLLDAMTLVTNAWVSLGPSEVHDVSQCLGHWSAFAECLSQMGGEADVKRTSLHGTHPVLAP